MPVLGNSSNGCGSLGFDPTDIFNIVGGLAKSGIDLTGQLMAAREQRKLMEEQMENDRRMLEMQLEQERLLAQMAQAEQQGLDPISAVMGGGSRGNLLLIGGAGLLALALLRKR